MNSSHTIYFIITRKCNYACPFCIRENIELPSQDVSYEDFVKVIDILSSAFTKCNLVITGGEPFFNKHFFDMLEYASNKVSSITVTSNGSFDEASATRLMAYLSRNVNLQLSLDGPQEIHDSLRGIGSFDVVIKNINRLKEFSNKLVISTTVGRDNVEYIYGLANILNNLSFHHWKVSPVQLRDPKRIDEEISSTDWNQFVDAIIPLCYFRVTIKKMFDFELMEKNKDFKSDSNKCIYNCGFGSRKFYITQNFNVLPCSCVNENVGNILTDDVADIKQRLTEIGNIVPNVDSVCYNCDYRHICNGGCPGYSLKCFGVTNMGDIRCPKVRSVYEKH